MRSLLVLVISFASTTFGKPQLPPQYVVSEVQILSARGESGNSYRVAKIENLPDNGTPSPDQLFFDGKMIFSMMSNKVNVLGEDGEAWSQSKTKLSEWQIRESFSLKMNSIFQPGLYEFNGLAGEYVHYRIRVVRACAVNISFSSQKSLGSKGDGVIATPTIRTLTVAKIERPPCFDESDRKFKLGAFELPPEYKAQVLKAQEQEKSIKAQNDFNNRVEKEIRDLYTQAQKMVTAAALPEKPYVPAQKYAEKLKAQVCPELGAVAMVVGFKVLKAQATSTEHPCQGPPVDGIKCYTKKTVYSVGFRNGSSKDYAVDGDGISPDVTSVTAAQDFCFDFEVLSGRDSDKTAKELREFFRVLVREKAVERVNARAKSPGS